MEEELVLLLKNDGDIAAVVGTRVFPLIRPQDEIDPAVVVSKISQVTDYTMQGPSGLQSTRMQVDCWAKTYAETVGLGRAVVDALSGAQFVTSNVDFQGIFLDNERDFYEDEGAERFYRRSLDFIVWHS